MGEELLLLPFDYRIEQKVDIIRCWANGTNKWEPQKSKWHEQGWTTHARQQILEMSVWHEPDGKCYELGWLKVESHVWQDACIDAALRCH